MPPYRYDYAPNPYAASIAETLARRGDIAAQRALDVGRANAQAQIASGQAWGQAASTIGQTVGQMPQQIAQQKRAAVQDEAARLELNAAKANQAGLTQANQIVSSLMTDGPDGSRVIDRAKAQHLMATANIPLTVQQSVFKALDDTDASIQKYQTTKLDHRADLAHSAIAMIDAGMDPHLATTTAATIGHQNGLISDGEIQQFMQGLSQIDPGQIRNALSGIRAQSEKYKEIEKPIVVPKDATLSTPSGRTIAVGQAGAPTAEEALIDSYVGSLKLPKGTTWDKLTPEQQAGFPSWKVEQTTAAPKPGTVEDFVARGRRLAMQVNGGKPLSDTEQQAVDEQSMAKFRTVNTDPEMRAARLALEAATLTSKDPNSAQSQDRLENSYRTALLRVISSRSGGMGLEDQKVNQAKHLLAIFDQNRDPKTGEYTVPKMMVNELALGLARLTSPNGNVGIELERDLNQRTAKGDLAGIVTYLTGTPVTGSTQDVLKMFRDSILRQGKVAEENRNTYLDSIRAMVPTDLSDERRQKVEKALNLNTIGAGGAASTPQEGTEGMVGGKPAVWKTVNGVTGWYAK